MNAERPERLRSAGWLLVVALALLPSLGTLGAPLVSDDGAILGYVHRQGPGSDWLQPEYGLRTVRFWRPLVTTTWDLQESLTGANPLPLRCFNVACHAAAAVLLGAIALALGAGPLGALVAGALTALFPHQGGNVTWIAGRVDSLCLPLCLGAILAALRAGRTASAASALSALLAFLALATKELAIAVPPAILLLAWARRGLLRDAARAAAPALAAAAVALVWRRLALGTWIGGYPQAPLDLASAARAVFGWVEVLRAPLAFALLVPGLALLATARAHGRADGRESAPARTGTLLMLLAALVGAALAAVPVVHVLIASPRSPLHFRTLALSDAFLCLAVSLALASLSPWRRTRSAVAAGALLLCAWRGVQAREDALAWAAGGRAAEEHVERVRAALRGDAPTFRPALDLLAPRTTADGRAYALHWGLADRFRAPFPAAPRPVWPWRPLFGTPASQRESAHGASDGLVRPADGGARSAPLLPVRVSDGGVEVEQLQVDARLFADATGATPSPPPRLEISGLPAGARIEVLLFTELGYEPAALDSAVSTEGSARATLRDVLLARVGGGDLLLWQVLAQAVDVLASTTGSDPSLADLRLAYLEVRAVDASPQAGGRVLASSHWIPLRWGPELVDLVLPF